MSNDLEVWLDCDLVPGITRVGTLSNDRGVVRFAYDSAWLENPLCFQIDPSLTLVYAAYSVIGDVIMIYRIPHQHSQLADCW